MEYLNHINFILEGMARAYPVIFPFAATFYSLMNENILGFILAGLAILSIGINLILKSISEILYRNYGKFEDSKCDTFWLRPIQYVTDIKFGQSAMRYAVPKNCGDFSKCQSPKRIQTLGVTECLDAAGIGMPSGHAQIATSMTLLLMLLIWAKNRNLTYQIIGTILIIGYAALTIVNRVVIGCHTTLQVMIGSFIGYLLGIAYYYFLNNIYDQETNTLLQIDIWWKHLILWAYPIIALIVILIMYFMN